MPHFQTQNLHVHASYPPFPHAKFARTRGVDNTGPRAICINTLATARALCIMANPDFALTRALYIIYHRKIQGGAVAHGN